MVQNSVKSNSSQCFCWHHLSYTVSGGSLQLSVLSVFSDSSHNVKTSPSKYLRLHVMPPFLQNVKCGLRQDSQFRYVPPDTYQSERIPICGSPSIGRYRSIPTSTTPNFNRYRGVLIGTLQHDRWRYFKGFRVYRQYALIYRQYILYVPYRAQHDTSVRTGIQNPGLRFDSLPRYKGTTISM